VSELRGTIYNLPWGSSIFAKVIAYNIYGDSAESNVGNGALIMTYPDAPQNLLEVYSSRTATTLGLSWEAGAQNGGSPIIDYTVSYAEGLTGSYVEL
jgi:hypothetical protein